MNYSLILRVFGASLLVGHTWAQTDLSQPPGMAGQQVPAAVCEGETQDGRKLDCSERDWPAGSVKRQNALVDTASRYANSDDVLPENSERLLPDETFSLWVSDEVAELLKQDRMTQARQLDAISQAVVEQGQAEVDRVTQRMSKVYFGSGYSNLLDRFSTQLEAIAKHLTNKRITRIKFIGHADTDRLSNRAQQIYGDNQGLSEARAKRVADYFESRLNIHPSNILVEGRADREPVASNATERGKAMNRRVDIQVWYADQNQPQQQRLVRPEPSKRLNVCRSQMICYEQIVKEQREVIRVRNAVPAVRFASGKADIRPQYVEQLRNALQAFKDKPNVRVKFIGHTDNQELSDSAEAIYRDNVGLSLARAREVAAFFQSRLDLPVHAINIDGRGPNEPVASNANRKGMALNRRVEIEIWHDTEKHVQAPPFRICDSGEPVPPGNVVGDRYMVQQDVGIQDPFKLADFRVTVDGEPVGSDGVHTADVQRCTDVALEKASVQVQYDSLSLEPRLNVTAWPNAAAVVDSPETPWADNVVNFQAYTNYSAFFESAEVRIYSKDQALSGQPRYIVNLNRDLQGMWAVEPVVKARLGNELQYVLRVYDKRGRFDETKPQPLWLDDRVKDPESLKQRYTAVDKELLVGYGESRLALQTIPLDGGTVTVNGRGVPNAHRVWVMDQLVPVSAQGDFVSQRIIPHGYHQVEVAMLDQEGSGDIFLRDLEMKQQDWFMVGIADVTIGVDDTNGPADLVTQDDDHYDSDFFADGRLAFYAKGKTEKGYTVTASADTKERPLEDLFTNFNDKDPRKLFRRLEQDQYYPTYGDDSTTVEDAPTQGKFYVKIEKRDNYAMWGNFDLTVVESDLAQIDRGLYGALVHLESERKTSFGEDGSRLDVFAAEPGTAGAREEFRGTGGSLYYLKHQDLTLGSDRVRIEIRDKDSDIVLQTRVLTPGQDYDIDPLQGRIILNEPLPATADDSQLVRAGSFTGNPVFLVARYEYSPGFEDLDDVAAGGRVSHWFGDNFKVGLTYSDMEQTGADQKVAGVDLTWRGNSGSYVKIDLARSEGLGIDELASVDGGFSFDTIQQSTDPDIEADAGRVEVGLVLGAESRVTAYVQKRERGFSSPGQLAANETEQAGLQFDTPIGEKTRIAVAYDEKDEDQRLKTEAVDVDVHHQLNTHWDLTVAARRDEREDRSVVVPATQTQGGRTDVAVDLGYDSNADWSAHGFVQGTVEKDGSREDNDRVGVGGEYRISERLKLDAEVSAGDLGGAGRLGVDYLWSDRTNLYLAYALENDRTDTGIRSRKGSITTGFKSRFSDALSVYGEERYTTGDVPTGLTHAYGVELAPSDYWSHGIGVEAGTLTDEDTGTELERRALHLSTGYAQGKTKYGGILEWREDNTDTEDRTTYLLKNTLNYQVNTDWRVLGKLNVSHSDSSRGEFFDGDFIEAVMGYGYRPVMHDRWNTLVKYTYFYNLPPSEQSIGSGSNTIDFIQRSHILGIDVEYDVNERWTVGGKYGYRHGEVSLLREDPEYFDSRAHLVVLRGEYHMVRHWDFLLEARMLELTDAEDNRNGILAAIYRHFGNHLKVGVGYNFTEFSDDLTDLDFDSQGFFLNVIGKM